MIDTTPDRHKDPLTAGKKKTGIFFLIIIVTLAAFLSNVFRDDIGMGYVMFEAKCRKPESPPAESIEKKAAGPLFKPLVKAMGIPDPTVSRYAVEVLKRHANDLTPDQVRFLLQSAAGKSKDYKTCVQAIISSSNNPALFDVFVEILDDADPAVRLLGAKELCRMGNRQAIEPLMKHLQDPDVKVRAAAANFLAMHRQPCANDVLLQLLNEQEPEIVTLAISGLSGVNEPRAVEPIIRLLNHSDESIRRSAASMLGWFRDKRAVEPLISYMKLEKKGAGNAAASLGVLGDSRAYDVLVQGLVNGDEWCRTKCAESLGMLKDKKAVKPLIKALQDKEKNVRVFAAQSLGQLRDPRAIPALDDLLEKAEQNDTFEASVIREAIRQIEQR